MSINPYSGADFPHFFMVLFYRLGLFLTGNLQGGLALDEIQMLVLIGVSISCALVGVFLVLRKMTMLANALSHTILLGIVLAFLITRSLMPVDEDYGINLEAMLIASVLTGILTTFLCELFHRFLRLQEDASIGLVFTTLFALGIILVTLFTKNSHVGTDVVMGNADALQFHDLKLVWIIALANIFLCSLFFKEYKITTFDPALAKALGYSTLFFNYLLMVQVSASAIGAFRAVGVLMVLAFIAGPALIARILSDKLKVNLLLAVFAGSAASILGVALSRHILSVTDTALSTGGLTVCLVVVFYIIAVIVKKALLRKRAKRINVR